MNHGRNRRGLSLVESLVSVVIGGMSIAALAFPLTAGALLQRQEKILDEARNLARLQMESIRSHWSTSQNWLDADGPNPNDVLIPLRASSWPYTGDASALVIVNMTPGALNNIFTLDELTYDRIDGIAALSPDSTLALTDVGTPNEMLPTVQVFYVNVPMRKEDGNLSTDYIGQVIVGRTPNVGKDMSRRVMVRIFAAERGVGNAVSFAVGTTGTQARGTIAADGRESLNNLRSGPLTVLINDISAPADYAGPPPVASVPSPPSS
jgi:type II secretory pathway pseudopilin PulG